MTDRTTGKATVSSPLTELAADYLASWRSARLMPKTWRMRLSWLDELGATASRVRAPRCGRAHPPPAQSLPCNSWTIWVPWSAVTALSPLMSM